jgi:hypothetical protein
MRTKEDNLLKIAEKYEKDLDSSYLDIDEQQFNKIFSFLLKDYRKIYKVCNEEGLETEAINIKECKEEFKMSTAEEKEDMINRIEERIASLSEACLNPPEDIDRKYAREKDLVDLFKV